MSSITSSLQTQARDAYRRKDYKSAVDLFSRALGRTPSAQLYDNRAACHDKLGDLPAALQDAKRAIQLSREDPTGYLRAGKVLIKSDKKAAALDIYAYGLGKVKHVGTGYEQLKKEHDKLQGELAPQNSLDPFTVLPRELAVLILEHLSFRQRVLVTKVSPDWRRFIHSEPNLWKHLDFTGGRHKVSTKFVSKAINIARPKITSVTLHRLWDFDKVLNALVKHCPLESITLGDVGMLGPDLPATLAKAKTLKEFRVLAGTKVSNQALWDILPLCKKALQILAIEEPLDLRLSEDRLSSLSDMTQLRELDLCVANDNNMHLMMTFLAELSSRAPFLENLKFLAPLYRHAGRLGRLDLSTSRRLKTVDLRLPFIDSGDLCVPPSLERLQLGHGRIGGYRAFCLAARQGSEEQSPGLSPRELPRLSSLSLHFPGVPMIDLEAFFNRSVSAVAPDSHTQTAPIVQFAIFQPDFPSADIEIRLPERLCTGLRSLSILQCLKLDDKRVVELVSQLPKLEFLDVSGSRVTGAGVKDIIVARDTLRHLVVRDCPEISRDAIDWARSKRVKVDNQSVYTDGKGGRKVVSHH